MVFMAVVVALASLWMAWPGLRRKETTSPRWYSVQWVLFGILVASTLFLLYIFYGLRLWDQR